MKWFGPTKNPFNVMATGCLHGILITAAIALALFSIVMLTGCGSRTVSTKAIDAVTKTTEITERQAFDPAGNVVVLTDKTTTFSESVTKEKAESETKIVPPPLVEMIKPAISAAAGAFGMGGLVEILGGVATLTAGAFGAKKAVEANKTKKALGMVCELADNFAESETDAEVQQAKRAAVQAQKAAGVHELIARVRA